MRVLLVNQHYPPDHGATGRLVAELAEGLAARGHDITVLTGAPSYPEARGTRPPRREAIRGVRIVRVPMVPRCEGAVLRGLHYLGFALGSVLAGLALPRPDALIAFSSTPTFGGPTARILALARRCRFAYVAQDVHPEMAVALGALRETPLTRLARGLEAAAWREADRVVVIGEEMRSAAAARGVPADRVSVIRNWADPGRIAPCATSRFRRELGFRDDDFVAQYAGNFGRAQDLDGVVRAAALARARDPRIKLLFVGSGSGEAALRHAVLGKPWARITPFEPAERLSDVLAAADLSIVSLRAGLSRWCVPSKVYSILASGRPVAAMVDAASEVARLVGEAGCGWRVGPGDVAGLARSILEAAQAPSEARARGLAGRAWLEREGGLRRALDDYEEILGTLTEPSRSGSCRPTLRRSLTLDS